MESKQSKRASLDIFELISKDWGLLTAGNGDSYNMMTVSWGTFGELWNRKIITVFVRPPRHTYGFMEKNDMFTLSFFEEEHRGALKICGSKSGRDIDKTAETGLTPVKKDGYVYFEEAKLVFITKKIYYDDIKPGHFLNKSIDNNYPDKDYHRFYIGEIVEII